MNDAWYVRGEGPAQIGPVSADLVRRGLVAGKVPLTAWVSRPGEPWRRVTEVPEIAAGLVLDAASMGDGGEPSMDAGLLPQAVSESSLVHAPGNGAGFLVANVSPISYGLQAYHPYGALALAPVAPRPAGRGLRIAAEIGAAIALGAGVCTAVVFGYRSTLPTVEETVAAGMKAGAAAPDLNRSARFRVVLDGRYITALSPVEGTNRPSEWHYRVTWKDGRVVAYEYVNPAATVTETTKIEYGEGDARVEQRKNGYGVTQKVTTITGDGALSVQWRSGQRDYENCAVLKRAYDGQGRVELERCLDGDGNVVARENGCFIRRFEYGADGDVSSTACLQDDLTPIADAEGVHRTRYRHDDRGRIVEESFFDTAGNRTGRLSDNCARIRRSRDSAGSIVEEACQDAGGAAQRYGGQSHDTVRTKRDENGCLVEQSYLDARTGEKEENYFIIKADVYCTELRRERRNAKGDLVGVAWTVKVNAEGLPVEKLCEAKSGPAQCPEYGYYSLGPRGSVHRWEYDDHGRMTSRRCFQPGGEPSMCDDEYPHEARYSYDEQGRLIASSYFDAEGRPALWLGVTREERSYNALGRLVGERYRNKESELVSSHCGEAGKTITYDAKQRETSIEFMDTAGKVVAPHCNITLDYVRWPSGAARVKVVREPGKPTRNEFYSASGSLIKTVDCSEANARCHD